MSKDRFQWICATLLTAGVVAFLWGGSRHPLTDASLGPLGTPDYFRAFARHVAGHSGWQEIHAGILAGPVLWALGAVGLARRVGREGDAGWAQFALVGLAIGSALWAVVFTLDGFVAPLQAAAVMAAGSSADAVQAFRSNQEIVLRLGLVSWLLIGTGIASLSMAARASSERARLVRFVLVPVGLVVGLWPLVAFVAGPFRPGPFTSSLWTATAIVTGVWFLIAAAALVQREAPLID